MADLQDAYISNARRAGVTDEDHVLFPALRCQDCDQIIVDDVAGIALDRLGDLAGQHRCWDLS